MSQFHPEDALGSQYVISNQDVILASDRDQNGAGDLIFKTGGVERARIKYDGSGTGWSALAGGIYNVKDYGAVGDGVTNDATAIAAAAAALQAYGSGILFFPAATYSWASTASNVLCDFSGLNGVRISGTGATITDSRTITTDNPGLFRFTNCKNITVDRLTVKAQGFGTVDPNNGLDAFTFKQGCTGVIVDADIQKCRVGVIFNRASSDPLSYKCKQINLRIKATSTYYPACFQFSGDDVIAQIDGNGCGRDYFAYGVKNHTIKVVSVNPQNSMMLKAYAGLGCEEVTLDYYNRDTTAALPAADAIQIDFGDTTPATHRNLRIRLDVKNPASGNFGSTIGFLPTGGVYGVGHVVNGLDVSGISEQISGKDHFHQYNSMSGGDGIAGVVFHDLILNGGTGSAWNYSPGTATVGLHSFRNVYSDGPVYSGNSTTSRTVFVGCQATNFTSGTSVDDTHTYVSCVISSGALQSTINKRFVDGTKFGTKSGSPGELLAYTQFTAPVTVTATAEATPNDVVVAGAVTFDGTDVVIEFYAPLVETGALASSQVYLNLWDGATNLGRIALVTTPSAAVIDVPVSVKVPVTPSAGSHTYKVTAYRATANGFVLAGSGGAGAYVPGYIRITRA